MNKLGFGGGCHWCTEAVFQSVPFVDRVEQGWIASIGEHSSFSEAVIVHFPGSIEKITKLVRIHLLTHSCTSEHSMRNKYRSAVYLFDKEQYNAVQNAIENVQKEFGADIISKILPFGEFKLNKEIYQDYYLKNKGNQFCQRYIEPKLDLIKQSF